MDFYNWGAKGKAKLKLPGSESLETVALEIAKFIADNLMAQGLTELTSPDGTVHDIEISVTLVPAVKEVEGSLNHETQPQVEGKLAPGLDMGDQLHLSSQPH